MSWAATSFDGRVGTGATVVLRVEGAVLAIVGREEVVRFPIREVSVGETFDHAPTMIGLPGGRTLEAPDPDHTLRKALREAGVRTSWVARWQSMGWAVAVALVLLVGGAAWIYAAGVPFAARVIAHAIPQSLERSIGERVLAVLDADLEPSRLPQEQRDAIEASFQRAAAAAAPGTEVRLEFRAGRVNAFALPGGIIVILDDLVRLADDENRVLGVLGHELGHVVGRHSMRQLLQVVGIGGIAALVWGDFSTVLANVPVILGTMRYGRAFEEEADRFSLAFMRKAGLPAQALLDMFVRLQAGRGPGRNDPVADFLSTHPGTAARIEWLRSELAKEAAETGEKAR